MNKQPLLISFSLILGTSLLAIAATPAPAPVKNAPSSVSADTPAPVQPAYKSYSYYGDKYRDPFIPLTGEFRIDQGADRPPQIVTLMLKGIVQDARGRMALLTSGASSYILKGGRLYDGRNRMVKKIAGVIKTESVVIIGADRTVREIKAKSAL